MKGEWYLVFCSMCGSGKSKSTDCPKCKVTADWVLTKAQAAGLGRLLAAVVDTPELLDLHVRKDGSIDVVQVVGAVRERTSTFDYLQPVHIRMIVETSPRAQYLLSGCNLRGITINGGGIDAKNQR